MSETETDNQAATPEKAAEPVVDKKLKRAKQSCITLFVVSIIALLSFGQPVHSKVVSDQGTRVNFNIIALLAWAMAIYAFFFLLFEWKRLFKVPKISKILGIVGCLILFANVACSLLGLFPKNEQLSMKPNQIFSAVGPAAWNIDGKDYEIDKCYFLRMDGGDIQYTIDYEYPKAGEIKNDEQALKVALPIMVHAYRCKKYGTVSSLSNKPQPAFIGVQIFTRNGNYTKGYRVALPLDEIKKNAG